MGLIKTPTAFYPEEIVIVGIDVPSGDGVGDGPRQAEEAVIDERFVLNVMALGVIEPVIIRRRPDGRLEAVEGRRRLRAAREANIRLAARGEDPIRVPVVLRTGTEADLVSVAFAGNEFGRGNSIMTRAWMAREYVNKGRTVEDAAARFCVDVATVKNWLALLDTAPRIQQAVAAGEIGLIGALGLGRLPPDQQGEALRRASGKVSEGAPRASTTDARRAAAEARGVRFITPPPKRVLKKLLKTPQARRVLERLDPAVLLQWIVGEIDGEDDTGVAEMVAALPARSRGVPGAAENV